MATPQLSRLVGRKMTRKISESNDAAKARKYKEEMNDLVIENIATMFAKALVLRRAIMNETKSLEEEEKTELTDLTQIEDAYKVVANRANGRWKTILDSQANFFGQQATVSMIGISVDRKTEEEEAKAAGDDLTADGESLDEEDGMSVTDLYRKGKKTVNDVKSKDFGAALGNMGEITSGFGAEETGKYIGKAGNLYNTGEKVSEQVQDGNYGTAAGTALGGVTENFGDKFGKKTTDILGKTQKGLNTSDRVVDDVKSENYGNVLKEVGNTTGEFGAEKVGKYIGKTGDLYNTGKETKKQVQDGNIGAATAMALGGVNDMIGDEIGDNARNTLKGTSSALGSADGAVEALKNKQWKNAWQHAETGYHNYERDSGRNKQKNKEKPSDSKPKVPASTETGADDHSMWNYGHSQNNKTEEKTEKDDWHAPQLPKNNDNNSKDKPSWADYGTFAGGNSGYSGNTSNNNQNNLTIPLRPDLQTGSNN